MKHLCKNYNEIGEMNMKKYVAAMVLGLALGAAVPVQCVLADTDVNASSELMNTTVSKENYEFVITDVYYTNKLAETNGNTTHSYGSDGNYLIIKMNFTNLATSAMEQYHSDRVSDMKLTYDGKYEYEGDFIVLTDDIVPLGSANAYLMFTVSDVMKDDVSSSLVAEFKIDGDAYNFVIQDGAVSENVEEEEVENDSSTESNPLIKIGDVRTDDTNFSFTFSDLYYTRQLSEQNGNTTHKYGSESYYLVAKLEFTNLKAELMEKHRSNRVSDMKLVYNDKYEYEGEFHVLVDDIVPLGTQNAYVTFEVPELVETSEESLIATFEVDGKEFEIDCRNYEYVTYSDAETVKKVQEKLNAEGFDCGTPDGVAGSGTYAALNAYQKENGLSVINAITDELLAAMELN